ncbi:MAG: hypothetical protein GC190_21960 [Alphaproteobacteria bacterium]|nr:hypothetical protein [Alphaproteobacteria bacterium]
MDRIFTYPGQIPLETDVLNTNRYAMEALGRFIDAILGTTTLVNGLVVAPNAPAALNVVCGNGEVYALENLDSTAYSSLAADTTADHQIIKQGILRDPVTLATAAPATPGNSINYLIQVAFQETDGGSTVLPYYNSADPSVAFSGPAGAGTPNYTVRQAKANVTVKAGTSAPTGTQTTPAPDAGFVGLAVVTVANGQSTVTAGDIALYSPTSYISETLTQKISQATGDLRYLQITAAQGNTAAFFGTAGGGPTAYTGSLTPAIAAYVDGMVVTGDFSATNSGTGPTLNLNSLGAKVIFQPDGTTQLPASTLPLNAQLMYRSAINAGAGGWVLLGVPPAASTTLAGITRYATNAEAQAGTVTAAAVTPAALSAALQQSASMWSASGLVIHNNTSTPLTQIDVSADRITMLDANGKPYTVSNFSHTINAALNGAIDRLDTGSLANNTCYDVWAIAKSDGTGVGAVLSLAANATNNFAGATTIATLNAMGYTGGFYMRLGTVITGGASTFRGTLQVGKDVFCTIFGASTALPLIISGNTGSPTTPTWTGTTVRANSGIAGAMVPAKARRIKVCLVFTNIGTSTSVIAAPNNSYGPSTSLANPPPMFWSTNNTSQTDGNTNDEWGLESDSVYYAASAGAAGNVGLFCKGWIEPVNAS